MKTKLLLVLCLFPAFAMADNVGGCGWGSKLFDGQKGIAPQVLAVTTNGTSGNQTFGISSGTSGCTQDGTVTTSWKTAAYIDSNMNRFAKDASRGQGETITSLAALIEIPSEKQELFAKTLQDKFSTVFPSKDASTPQVLAGLRSALAGHAELSAYSNNF
jgi:hypothetical protein